MTETRLYLISPPQIDLPVFAKTLEDALFGGDVGAFQLRLKNASDKQILKAAEVLIPICCARNVAFIMNDRPDLAKACGADGIHIGQEDGGVAAARKIVGDDAIIGVSCHNSRHMAMVAGEEGADYVAFGAFYPTTSKSAEALAKYGTPTTDILSWWSEYMVLPCVAIGGINPQNALPLVQAGTDFIAAIQAVWNHPKGAKVAVEEFNNTIKQGMKK